METCLIPFWSGLGRLLPGARLASRQRLKILSVSLCNHSRFQRVENAILNEAPNDGGRVFPVGPDLNEVVEVGHVNRIEAALDLWVRHSRGNLAVLQMDAKWSTKLLPVEPPTKYE